MDSTVVFLYFADSGAYAMTSSLKAAVAAGQDLVRQQELQHSQGRDGVELVRSIRGWTVRSCWGFDGFAIRYRARSFNDAVSWAYKWVKAGSKREAYVRSHPLKTALGLGKDLHTDEADEIIEFLLQYGRSQPEKSSDGKSFYSTKFSPKS